ncbi:hypothetical protein OS493_025857 [Desmophyllum pertusum]|uniref:Uncharacterized protein n=1 Tax=Desmophyllum pertusum TaxID=174260 RepID=A0A9W9YXX4_9CNID|nr:hypothetical protein OS493_025857 [Desmophyllum pertusum]
MTTSASHPAQSGDIEHPPPPQAPYHRQHPFLASSSGLCSSRNKPEVPPPEYPYPLEEPTTLPWRRKCSTVPTTRSIVSMATRQCYSRSVRTRRESINLWLDNLLQTVHVVPETLAKSGSER